MGLAGRKQKQRIPADPRNLSWADDASRFGLSYLSKFGWDASKSLGSSGDGMKTHLKVQQKLDMVGIGAQHQGDPNGIAWKQNKDFEALLKRLNESGAQGDGVDGEDAERVQEENNEEKLKDDSPGKRKRKDRDDADTNKKKKKRQKEKKPDLSAAPGDKSTPSLSNSLPKPRPMAHRARIRAAKRIADKSASAISEILGIARSSSASTSTPTPASTPLPSSTPAAQPSVSLDNLTTSSKSLADYFKEKLLSRSSSFSSPSSSVPSGSTTPGLGTTGLGFRSSNLSSPDDDDELPRRGIGSRLPAAPPPPQVPESEEDDHDSDGCDTLTEKQRRKAERKAERRKRREAEGASVIPKDQVVEDGEEGVRRKSKEKKSGREKRGDDAADKNHERSTTAAGDSSQFDKKIKKEHKRKRSRAV